jgi:hypothetical protein
MGALHLHFYNLIKLIFFRILLKLMRDHTGKATKIRPFDIFYFRPNEVQFSAQVKDFFCQNEIVMRLNDKRWF